MPAGQFAFIIFVRVLAGFWPEQCSPNYTSHHRPAAAPSLLAGGSSFIQ